MNIFHLTSVKKYAKLRGAFSEAQPQGGAVAESESTATPLFTTCHNLSTLFFSRPCLSLGARQGSRIIKLDYIV